MPSPTQPMSIPAMARSHQPSAVDHGRIERDGVAEIGAVVHHIHQQRLARGDVECVGASQQDTEGNNLPDGHRLGVHPAWR